MYSQSPYGSANPYASAMSPSSQYYASAMPPSSQYLPMDGTLPLKAPRAPKKRLNLMAIVANALLPSCLFIPLFSLMSFSIHYQHSNIVYVVALIGAVPVLLCFWMGMSAKKGQDTSWSFFATFTFLLATVLAIVLGDVNFWNHMQPVYDIENLNAYPSVNPAKERGGQLMDAGKVYFTDGTKLDFSKSMRFRNYDEYCVVPIVHGKDIPATASYDFWAVGLNCCSGASAEFRCGEFNNPKARSGLRLMRDAQRPFFRLAVQQAEAAYKIKAAHPVFFYWMENPSAEVNSYRDDGYKQFLVGMFMHFSFNLLCVVVAVALFSKGGK